MLANRMMMSQLIAFLKALQAWGDNSTGRTGLNISFDVLVPTQVGTFTTWTSCDAGGTHSLAVKANGTLWSFGNNADGRTGLNTITGNVIVPTQVGSATNWSNCSAGSLHSLAIKTDGTLWSFGNNSSGETGLGTNTGSTLVPTQVGTATNWSTCSAGNGHSLAVKTDGTLWSFGFNGSGRTGLNTTVGDTLVPTQVGTDTNWSTCRAGNSYSLAVKTDKTLWSFGSNTNGRTGLNTTTGNALVPTQVGTDTDWSSCSTGDTHSLAVKIGGTLWSFGNNVNGKTGLNTSTGDTLVPTQVGTDINWASCDAGALHSLAVKTNGTLYSFGNNANGRTGLNTITGDTLVPTQVGTDTNWSKISAGTLQSLVTKTTSALWSFGSGPNGETGLNIHLEEVVPVSINTDWASCSAGGKYSLAVKKDGTLWSFGSNGFGVTGLGIGTGSTLVPTQVGIAIWASCSAGNTHSLAIKTDGTLWSFGTNLNGATGRNTTTGDTLSPAKVGTATNWSNCSAGDTHSLAVKADGTLWAFGSNNNGRTGLNLSSGTKLVPTQVGTDINWASCSAGFNYSLAVKTDGTLWAFGANGSGQLGLGSAGTTLVPTQVGTDTNWASCDAGSNHSLAVKTDGTLWSFGTNVNGATGLGTNTGNTLVPTQVGATTNWSNCSAGNGYSLAVKTDGTLWSFGTNVNGRTGLNTITGDTLSPAKVGSATNWSNCSAGDTHSLGISRVTTSG